jgi:integrase
VFLTKFGKPWVRVDEPGDRTKGKNKAVVKDSVATEFGKTALAAGLEKDGRGFYALRHTFRTVADEVGDRRAVDLIMGHEDGSDIASHYVERISDERLAKVARYMRGWANVGRKDK